LKLPVDVRVYEEATENEQGTLTLTFKGKRFLKFENENGILER